MRYPWISCLAVSSDLGRWMMSFGLSAAADADHDGDSEGPDVFIWQRQLGSAANLFAVPEYTSTLSLFFSHRAIRMHTKKGVAG